MTAENGTVWLNPNDLPGGCQVRAWPFDDDGQPIDTPISLETVATHTELSRVDAARLGRALIAAAAMSGDEQ